MEPDDDARLHKLLREWDVPDAPPSLDARLTGGRVSWWRFLLTGRIRVPVPLGLAVVAALLVMGVLLARGRGRVAALPPASEATHAGFSLKDFQPVQNVRVRVIRSGDARE
jgi:hypothetical protein